MAKIDLRKELKHLYKASAREPVLVEVPPMNFLMIDGAGDPNTARGYQEALEALYAMAYALKFMIKKEREAIDYTVMHMEGLWWADDMSSFSRDDKGSWQWTMMILQPRFVTADHVARAFKQVEEKKNPPALSRIRFEEFDEGLGAQILHVGPYDAELPTIIRLHKFIEESGHELRGRHHEIYLGDPRRTAPEKLKTILRQPVA